MTPTTFHSHINFQSLQSLSGIHEKRCGPVALELFWCLVTWADLTDPHMMNVATLMWSYVMKYTASQVVVSTISGGGVIAERNNIICQPTHPIELSLS